MGFADGTVLKFVLRVAVVQVFQFCFRVRRGDTQRGWWSTRGGAGGEGGGVSDTVSRFPEVWRRSRRCHWWVFNLHGHLRVVESVLRRKTTSAAL